MSAIHPAKVRQQVAKSNLLMEDTVALANETSQLVTKAMGRGRWLTRIIWLSFTIALAFALFNLSQLAALQGQRSALNHAEVKGAIVAPHEVWRGAAHRPSLIEEVKATKAIPIVFTGSLPKGAQAWVKVWAKNGRPYSLGTFRVTAHDLQAGTVNVVPLFFIDLDEDAGFDGIQIGYTVEYSLGDRAERRQGENVAMISGGLIQ